MTRLARADLRRHVVAGGGLAVFAKCAWPYVDPAPLRWSWHHDLICDRLEKLARREIRKLIIMVPPGSTKTILASVMYPTWVWTFDPARKFVAGSYGDICLDAARKHRSLVQSDFYRPWGVTIPHHDTHASGYFKNSRGGSRFSTSVRGPLTGHHAHDHIGDDLNKVQDALGGSAYTMTALDDAWRWWNQVLPTRQVDPALTGRMLIGQRIHERDVPGRWLEDDPEVEVLCLPMRYDSNHPHVCPDDPRTKEGELLWPEHIPEEEVQELERVLGPVDASAQLQQLPVPAGGAVFQRDWVGYYHRPDVGRTIQSWDMAFRDARDPVVGQVWRRSGDFGDILDSTRGRWDFPTTVDRLIDLTLRWPESSHEVLIENKANGPAVEAELRRSYVERCRARGVLDPPPLRIRLVDPQGGKLARAHAVTGLWSAGHVRFPESAPWLSDLLYEILRFTGRGAEQDDQVDAMTQALTYLFGSQQSRWLEAMKRYRQRGAA